MTVRNMKRIFLLLLSFLFLYGVAGCFPPMPLPQELPGMADPVLKGFLWSYNDSSGDVPGASGFHLLEFLENDEFIACYVPSKVLDNTDPANPKVVDNPSDNYKTLNQDPTDPLKGLSEFVTQRYTTFSSSLLSPASITTTSLVEGCVKGNYEYFMDTVTMKSIDAGAAGLAYVPGGKSSDTTLTLTNLTSGDYNGTNVMSYDEEAGNVFSFTGYPTTPVTSITTATTP